MMYSLLGKVWQEEVVPADWNTGHFVKLPKKSDKCDCGTYRGITPLSVPGKVHCRVILERLTTIADDKLETTKPVSIEKDPVRTRSLLYELPQSSPLHGILPCMPTLWILKKLSTAWTERLLGAYEALRDS